MAGKQTGVGLALLSVDDAASVLRAILNDITNWDLAMPRGVQDTTGQDSLAMERLLLLADASVNLTGVFNADANKSHDVFKSVPTTSVPRTTTLDLGTPTFSNEFLYTDYQVTRDPTATLIWASPGVLTGGTFSAWA